MGSGWIGVDLDGTIAEYHGWDGGRIGKPIAPMVDRVKAWIGQGIEVRIFTARMSDPDPTMRDAVAGAIGEWCDEHIGHRLKATCAKDYAMICLYDDRAVQVEVNTGRLIGEERMTKCPTCGGLPHATGVCNVTLVSKVVVLK